MLTSLNAQEITDNLLNNHTFDENTNGWTLSDSNVKRDSNSYTDAGSSPTVRFKGQTSTISQSVSLNNVIEGKEIQSYTIKYNGYGCGNSPGGWCLDEADDTIVTNITFTDGTTTEVSSHTIAVPYEDGWTHHVFTKSINDSFITGNVAINFELSGIDTGNSNSWLGPITDNYEFMITYDDFVAPVVEPIVEETMIGGLDLSTEVTLDLIQEIRVEIPQMDIPDLPEIQPIASIDIDTAVDMPDMTDMPAQIDMPTPIQEIKIEMPADIPEIADVEPIQEIQEIEPQQPEMAGAENDQRSIEPEAEGQIEIAEAKAETGGELSESKSTSSADTEERSEENSSESKTDTNKGGEPSDTTEVAAGKDEGSNSEGGAKKSKPKSKAKADTKASGDTKPVKKINSKPKATLPVNTAKPKTIAQLPLPIAYLQNITESITLVETISLQQEMIYGGQQVDNLNTSSITIIALDNNTSSRWSNLQNERKRFKAPKYRK